MISAADDESGEPRSAAAPAPADAAAVPMCPPALELDRGLLAGAPAERRRELLEPWLREVAAEALGIGAARLDPRQPLTAYGLDSLGAVDVQSRLETHLGIAVSVADLLAGASLADLAAAVLVDAAAAAEEGPAVELEALGPAAGRFPLAHNQQALWLVHRLAPRSLAYHLVGAARVEGGALERGALERALAALVERHAALRTTFPEDGEGPWQEVGERGGGPPAS